jgi:serine/threonine protein kinase/formylglycine-generating enzyme required for sulfatase activity
MPADLAAVKALFLQAAALDDPAARAALVDERCGGDAALRDRVHALLAANDRAEEGAATASLGPGAGDPAPTADFPGKDERIGAVLAGRYKLIEAIGEGGMGSVYMAQQTEPVKRPVAVKVIKAGMDSKAVLARFEAERQALAMMDHPNIAKVLDAGTTDGGRSFFVMELVKGTPITRYCDEHRLTPRQRLELFVPVCQAIQHAHQKGIIHRDIKPSNVLVALYDDRPVPKVIDFGVAKAAGQSLTEQTLMTGFGQIVGTPEYMSPEQATLNNLDIDTRSDVYSLGVLLYELLTGTTPVDKKSLGKAALLEILRMVREVEAQRPSTKLSTLDALPSVAANRGTEPAKLSRLMRGELDWLVMKALEKDRTRRYETANGLARDIQRYLADEVVEARPPSVGYRVRKLVRRHKGQVIAASLVLFGLFAGIVGTTWGLFEAKRSAKSEWLAKLDAQDKEKLADEQRKAAEAEAAKAKKARDFLVSLFELSDHNSQRGIMTARQLLDHAEQRIPNEFADQPESRAEVLAAIETAYAKMTANSPLAMILEVSGTVQLQSTRIVNRLALPQTLLYAGDRLRLAADAHVQLVILSDLHKELLRPGTEATVRRKGCEPQGAISQRVEDILLTFVRLPKATFYMGWGADAGSEITREKGLVRHLVTKGTKTAIKEDFEIAVHDVTQGQWQAVMGNNPSYYSRFAGGGNQVKDISDEELKLFPVDSVTWTQAQEFIRKLNEQNRGSGWTYRLPTDVEWEYACRGGATSEEECSYHFYFAKPTNDAPKWPFLQRTTRVGAYPPNKLGLCDMYGNVSQWCANALIDKRQGSMGMITRGGGCRAGDRSALGAGYCLTSLGFRLVRVRDREVAKRFPALLRGEDQSADNVERLGFAQLAYDHKKVAIAARLWAEALASDPTLGEDRQTQHRYNAACAAALAAAGQGKDEPTLDDAAKAKLRRQALDWLKSELGVWNEFVPGRNDIPVIPGAIPVAYQLVVETLRHWQKDSDLASIRDSTVLAKLPADEQKAFTRLWADVAALLRKAGGR